jgi:hypothetical protein
MIVKLTPELGQRLLQAARERAQTVTELVDAALTTYLDSLSDDPLTSVKATRHLLPRVWPVEDFSDWHPPDGR